MKKTIQHIIKREFVEEIKSIKEIVGLGKVNRIFEIIGERKNYIIRANKENKEIEYQKEKWCLNEMNNIGVKSPKVLKMGKNLDIIYMIQNKIEGKNGKLVNSKDKLEIWYRLGIYAKKYHEIKRIKVDEFEKNEFHKSWKSRLNYNIKELNEKDSLLKNKILTKTEHEEAKKKLLELNEKELREGLIHGDLCPRNVIMSNEGIYLLDWGTAEINVTPHIEIGLVMMSNEANENEFTFFLKGLGVSKLEYQKMEEEIIKLNFLHSLDKYRWAESYDLENIVDYEMKIKETFKQIKNTAWNNA